MCRVVIIFTCIFLISEFYVSNVFNLCITSIKSGYDLLILQVCPRIAKFL
jgi:hypothetical protein